MKPLKPTRDRVVDKTDPHSNDFGKDNHNQNLPEEGRNTDGAPRGISFGTTAGSRAAGMQDGGMPGSHDPDR